MNKAPFTIETTFPVPAGKIWEALTIKEQMKQWHFDLADFRPEIGFEFTFTGTGNTGEPYMHLCRITEVINRRKLSHTWQYKGFAGMSQVTSELFPEDDATTLQLTHNDLEKLAANGPDFAHESCTAGWTYIIGTFLKNFIEKEYAFFEDPRL